MHASPYNVRIHYPVMTNNPTPLSFGCPPCLAVGFVSQLLYFQMTEENSATADVRDISQEMEKFSLSPDGSVKQATRSSAY